MNKLLIISVILLTGCSSTPIYTQRTYAQDQMVYNSQGQRIARIDSKGNIYATQGPQAGQRQGRIK